MEKADVLTQPSLRPQYDLWVRFAENEFLCFLRTDNKGTITFINRAGEKMHGYSARELVGKHVSILYRGVKLNPPLHEMLKRKSRRGEPWEAEIWNVRKSGEKFPVWIASNYLFNEKGERIGALSIARDISADVRAREEARHLGRLAEQINMALISTDARGKIVTVNKAVEDLFGYHAEELIGKSISLLYSVGNPPDLLRKIKRRLRKGRGYVAELYRRRKDGSEFVTLLSTSPLSNSSGRLNGHLGVGRDVTQERKREQQLRYMAELVDRACLCILSTDRDNIIRSINPAGETMYGYSAREIIGKNRDILYKGIVLPPRKRFFLTNMMKRGVGWVEELDNVRKNGTQFPIRIATAYLYDTKGHRKGAVSIAEDITHERKLKNKLIESAKLASLGQAAAGIAHEIKNPLTAIKNIAHSCSGEEVFSGNEEKRQLLDDLNLEIIRLEKLASDFLAFAWPRTPRKEMARLHHILKDALRLFSKDRELGKGISFKTKLPDVGEVPVDLNQVKQVVWNLILNALQAMESRGTLTVSTFRKKGHAGFTIKDTGLGIPSEVRGRIFEPFFTTRSRGSGLGLAIVKRIIDQHGGKIEVTSQQGRGTTVTVVLPRNGLGS